MDLSQGVDSFLIPSTTIPLSLPLTLLSFSWIQQLPRSFLPYILLNLVALPSFFFFCFVRSVFVLVQSPLAYIYLYYLPPNQRLVFDVSYLL